MCSSNLFLILKQLKLKFSMPLLASKSIKRESPSHFIKVPTNITYNFVLMHVQCNISLGLIMHVCSQARLDVPGLQVYKLGLTASLIVRLIGLLLVSATKK